MHFFMKTMQSMFHKIFYFETIYWKTTLENPRQKFAVYSNVSFLLENNELIGYLNCTVKEAMVKEGPEFK